MRRHPDPATLAEAIHLDPANGYAYTLQAEVLEQQRRWPEAEQAWSDSLGRNPRNPEAWIRLGLLAERRGDIAQAENHLLEAARLSHTWLPRWSLTNFYLRQGRVPEFREWARQSLLRASDDVAGMFPLLEEAGLTPGVILRDILPVNRRVLSAWLAYRLQRNQTGALYEAAESLATLIPEAVPAWPGLDGKPVVARKFPAEDGERFLLLSATDCLRDHGYYDTAQHLWNTLCSRAILASDPWSLSRPLVNGHFFHSVQNAGFDWRLANVTGARIAADPGVGGLTVRLNGSQPEQADAMVRQPVIVPAGRAYRLVVESRTDELPDSNGLRWEIRESGTVLNHIPIPSSAEWRHSAVEFPPEPRDRAVDIALAYTRLPGTVRAEGAVEFRLVSLEPVP